MIIKKVRGKNFFSIGNDFLEIDVQKYDKSVVTGKNGNGKSTIASLITFGLFGKPIKSVIKSQIINSINGKNCLVEIEFHADGNDYLIRRGIKPNIFEIHKNSELIDQSSVLDYQTYLEQIILKCTFRTFLQTSIISIENYKPFMSLPAKERRDFIEDILDIKVFTQMNQLVKINLVKNKEEIKLLDITSRGMREKITLQKSHIDTLEEMRKTGLDVLDEKINTYQSEIEELNFSVEKYSDLLSVLNPELTQLKLDKTKQLSIQSEVNSIKSQIKLADKDISFFESHTDCPTCRQQLDSNHSATILETHKNATKTLLDTLTPLYIDLELYEHLDGSISDLQTRISSANSEIVVNTSSNNRLNRLIKDVDKEKKLLSQSDDIKEQRAALAESAKKALDIRNRLTEINVEQDYNNTMLELFKDTGIKSKIVDQYIPIVNKLVNQYLDKLDFFVSFTLDAEFNETIKSRHRDDFTYSSFSAGERQKIDIALLFTFRHLARMRNAFACNLLLMDEIMDASIDSTGIDLLMDIFDTDEFSNTNLMIISHANKDKFEERFDGLYEFYKRDNFTQFKEG